MRGCGVREQGGIYVCADVSTFGEPIYYFLVDAVLEWRGARVLRSPMVIEDRKGINHLVLGVGVEFYPFVSDFVEEAKFMGVSKRVPRNFDFSVLTPLKSRLLLVHRKAIPTFRYEVEHSWCPKSLFKGDQGVHRCVGDLWALSSLEYVKEKHELIGETKDGYVKVKTPSVEYRVSKAYANGKPTYKMGIFLCIPKFHFEYVNKKGKAPKELKRKIEKAGFRLEVCSD